MRIAARNLLPMLLLTAIAALAQQGLNDWSNVKNIAPGSDIWVKATHGSATGAFQSADDQAIYILRWRRRPFVGGSYSQPYTILRSDVRQVRFAKRPLSALAGTAIGVAAGVAIGAGLQSRNRSNEDGNLAAAVFGIFGGLIGEGVGEHTAFIHGAKIYVAP